MKLLDRLERRMGRYSIRYLMKYLCAAMLGVFVLEYLPLPRSAVELLYFNRDLIVRGQVWRLITFIFLPPTGSLLWILFSLYFYFFLGTSLENQWGSAQFNLYYAIGVLGNILSGFLTGFATNHFLNISLLLAFAVLYPEMQITLFFVLPVKMRWIGGAWGLYLLYQLLTSAWPYKLALVLSFLPFVLFFGPQARATLQMELRRAKRWIQMHKK